MTTQNLLPNDWWLTKFSMEHMFANVKRKFFAQRYPYHKKTISPFLKVKEEMVSSKWADFGFPTNQICFSIRFLVTVARIKGVE